MTALQNFVKRHLTASTKHVMSVGLAMTVVAPVAGLYSAVSTQAEFNKFSRVSPRQLNVGDLGQLRVRADRKVQELVQAFGPKDSTSRKLDASDIEELTTSSTIDELKKSVHELRAQMGYGDGETARQLDIQADLMEEMAGNLESAARDKKIADSEGALSAIDDLEGSLERYDSYYGPRTIEVEGGAIEVEGAFDVGNGLFFQDTFRVQIAGLRRSFASSAAMKNDKGYELSPSYR